MILHAHKYQGAAVEQLKRLVEIRLDGMHQKDVIACDTKRNCLLRYRRFDGRFVVAPGGENIARELVEGNVAIHFK